MNTSLRLGIGNGSLLKPVAWCLRELGLPCDTETRLAWQDTGHGLIPRIFMSRPQHVVTGLQQGAIDCALIGKDMLYEYGQADQFTVCAELGISKTGFTNLAKVVLFRRQDPDSTVVDFCDIRPDTKVLSEYPRLTARYLEEKGIQANIVPSSGGTEHAVAAGLYDLGVGITETGGSLRANNLCIMDCLLEATVVLCVRAGDPCEKLVRYLGELLQGTLKSRQYVLLKMNVGAEQKAGVVAAVPSLKAPTIHELDQGQGFVVETVAHKKELAWLVIQLKELGTRDFIWHELGGVVP